jgi:hypothetical protein
MIDDLLKQARAKGTDTDFREWVQKQPSCITFRWSEWLVDVGEFRNPACHIRRAGKSGTAHKEAFACVPMTNEEHHFQHQHGEAACLNRFLNSGEFTREEAADWFDRQRERYLRLWLAS